MAMDMELAEQLLALEGDDVPAEADAPTPDGYTLDTYLLLTIIDGLQGVQAAVIAAAGADPPQARPMPRPVTALDLVREGQRMKSMQKLIDTFSILPPDDGSDDKSTEVSSGEGRGDDTHSQ
ncbi:hypothetical protein [Nocardia sp. IFM 10818]